MSDPEDGKPPVEGDADAEAAAKAAAAKERAEAAARAKAEREAAEAAKPAWERDPKAPETEDASTDPVVVALAASHGDSVASATTTAGDLTLIVAREAVGDVCASLKDELGFKLLVDVCGAHYPKREEAPFEVIYHVFNIDENRRVRVKVECAEDEEVPTVCTVWQGANWCERETYDMYGIRFAGHPDMTRILLWEGFNGHPLRQDFPVEGIDTGTAIYPEFYEESAGPVIGTGTGWKPPQEEEPADETPAGEEG